MKKKLQYIVFGMGRFGRGIAQELAAAGVSVCIADKNPERIKDVADYVTNALVINLNDIEQYEQLGDTEYDGAVVAIGEALEAAIHSVMWAKEHGIPMVIAKASNETYGKILTKVGADKVIFPELEMGIHLARGLVNKNLLESAEFAEGYSIADIPALKSWVGKTVRKLNLREKYGVNIVGLKKMSRFDMSIKADYMIEDDDILVILGKTDVLKKLK